jgi:hypothetical protein
VSVWAAVGQKRSGRAAIGGDDRASVAEDATLAARVLLELGALAALGAWGWHAGTGRAAKLGRAAGAPLVAAVVWGRFVDPPTPPRAVRVPPAQQHRRRGATR